VFETPTADKESPKDQLIMRYRRHWMHGLLLMLMAAGLVNGQDDPSQIPNVANQPGVLLPPGTPPGAYDSLVYAKLIRNAPCPGLEDKSSNHFTIESNEFW
jgi:hypothetical protein